MAKRAPWRVPEDLGQVQQRVEEWRETRAKRGAMPEELWSAAVAAAEKHGLWRASRVLRVNYGDLRRRKGREQRKTSAESVHTAGFVELSAPKLEAGVEAAGAVVELCSADGAKLQIRLPGGEPLDVRGLAEAFWRRGA